MVFEKIPHSLAQGGVIVWGVDRLIEHVGEDRQHLFFQLAMLVMQLLEVLFGGGGSALHTLEEHRHELVAGMHLGLVQETDQQTVASGLVLDVAHIPDVEGGSFCGKLLHLGMGNVGEEGPGRQEGFEPRETRRPLAQVFERGLARRGLDAIKVRAPVTDG